MRGQTRLRKMTTLQLTARYVVKVPQSSGEEATINRLQLCQAVKNIGPYAPPEGSSKPQLQALRDRVDEWTSGR